MATEKAIRIVWIKWITTVACVPNSNYPAIVGAGEKAAF
jgi:hypothetical protein